MKRALTRRDAPELRNDAHVAAGGLWRRLIRAPFRLLPPDAVVRVPAGPMRGMRWMPASAPHGAWLGRLERKQLEAFIACIHRGMTVWDVGANVGLYALPAGAAVGDAGHVYAFEPMARNLTFLRRHVEINRLSSVHVVDAAVWDTPDVVTMDRGDSPSEARVAEGGAFSVQAITLDGWWQETATPAPSLIKIDVEGAEDRVLAGARRVLESAGPVIFLSLHGERQRHLCLEILQALDYGVSSLQSGLAVGQASEWRAERRGGRHGT